MINGKALPAGDLQTGTITVRVVRESIGNNIVGQQVTMTVNGETKKAVTDEQGRAEFKGLPAGANARAAATVNGEQLQSDPFVVPSSGGLRVILVAGIAQAAERKKQMEAGKSFVDLARDTGAMAVKVRPNGFPNGVPHDTTIQTIAAGLRELAEY